MKPQTRNRRSSPRRLIRLLAAGCFLASLSQLHAQRIFFEGFDELPLGPNVEELLTGSQVWTKTPPAGWTIDDSKMPGVGNPAQNGITEWAGWSFANKNWWIDAADDQRRSEFVFGQGTVLIADPDEWDDADHAQGLFDSTITTASIAITNQPANSLVLVYDSSWRPESLDDGAPDFPEDAEGNPINDQTGYITASFNGTAATEIQRWDSISDSPNYHDHTPNEAVVIPLNNPAGATNLVLKFGMEKAANDWWWAVDNIAVGVPPFAAGIGADGVSFTVRIVEALGKSVDATQPVTVALDSNNVTPVNLTQEGSYRLVNYSQSPQVFHPKVPHTVRVQYTTSDAQTRDEVLTFVGPGYTTAVATPNSVTLTITDAEWLTVDETKGVTLELDGVAVTNNPPIRTEGTVTVRYSQTNAFAANSTHTMKVTFTTAAGVQVVEPVEFTVPNYVTLPASLATALGTGAEPGMRWRTHQLETNRANSISEAEKQLAGTLGPSVHDTTGQGPNGYFLIDYVNFDQASAAAGNFSDAAEPPQNVPDLPIPGIPGTTGSDNYIAGEALAFVEIPQPGVYSMVVNSDDGFQVTVGNTNNPNQIVLGKWDGSRGSADTAFYFNATNAGVYLFRLLWFEGDGGANVEWFTVNPDGSRALVGGTQTGSLKAYRVRTVAEPGGGGTGNIISHAYTEGKLVITYTGELRSAPTISGPFQPVAGASSPYSATPTGPATFFIAQ